MYRLQYTLRNPLAFYLLLLISFLLPSLVPFTYLETLLAVTGSVQVACKLTSPFSTLPNPSPLQIPSTQVTKRLTMTTSRIWLLLSGTTTFFSFLFLIDCSNFLPFLLPHSDLLFPSLSSIYFLNSTSSSVSHWLHVFSFFPLPYLFYLSLKEIEIEIYMWYRWIKLILFKL